MSKRSQAPPAGDGQPPVEGEGEEGGPKARPQNKRLQQTQAQVDEVVEVMKMNLDKVLERDAKLGQLDDRADALQEGASQFQKSANTLKDKMWWKNMKMTLIMIAVGLVVVFILFGQYIFPQGVPGVGGAGKEGAAGTPAVATGPGGGEKGKEGEEGTKEGEEGGDKEGKEAKEEKGDGDKEEDAKEKSGEASKEKTRRKRGSVFRRTWGRL